MTRLTTEHHDTLAATIGRRKWSRTRTDIERATLVLEHMSGFGVEHVTPAQVAVAMQAMPLNAQDIANYADVACALAAVLPRVQA